MPVQVWDRTGTDFYGQSVALEGTVSKALNAAAEIAVSAPYHRWRELMEISPNFHQLIVTGPAGEDLATGYWHTRDDDPLVPGNMAVGGSGLLDELRAAALPQAYTFTNWSVLLAIQEALGFATGWSLGDTSLASDLYVTAAFGGESVLEGIISLCEMTGNFLVCDSRARSIDILASLPDIISAHIVHTAPSDSLPSGVGRIIGLTVTEDCGETFRGVAPFGSTYRDEQDRELDLAPLGSEDLPAGFSFESVGGQLYIVNDAVSYGLVRQLQFGAVSALSNTDASASGVVEDAGLGWIESDAVRRPDPTFWVGGTVKFGDVEYPVTGQAGSKIYGGFGAQGIGSAFSLRKEFVYDTGALDDARATLVSAAVAFLRNNATAKMTVTATVSGLDTMPLPGQMIHVECIAQATDRDVLTDVTSRFLWQGFYGDLVVIACTAQLGQSSVTYEMDLSNSLGAEVSDTGLYEMRSLTPRRGGGSKGRGRGAGYTVRITSTDVACGTNSHEATYTFPEAYAATPAVLEVVPLDDRYTASVTSVSQVGFTVCATYAIFDEVNVLVRVREP